MQSTIILHFIKEVQRNERKIKKVILLYLVDDIKEKEREYGVWLF